MEVATNLATNFTAVVAATAQSALATPAPTLILNFFSRSFPYWNESLAFTMAMQSALHCKHQDEEKRKKGEQPRHWFHSFVATFIISFGGGIFLPPFLGSTAGMFTAADVLIPICAFAFSLVYFFPTSSFFTRFFSLPPVTIVITACAQNFRSAGVVNNTNKALSLCHAPSWYAIPLLGPILAGTLSGNVGLIYRNGWEAHFKNGCHWNFENGMVTATFYHLYANDKTGFLGVALRDAVSRLPLSHLWLSWFASNEQFALVCVSAFFVVVGVLQLDLFFSSKFNPFLLLHRLFYLIVGVDATTGVPTCVALPPAKKAADEQLQAAAPAKATKKGGGGVPSVLDVGATTINATAFNDKQKQSQGGGGKQKQQKSNSGQGRKVQLNEPGDYTGGKTKTA